MKSSRGLFGALCVMAFLAPLTLESCGSSGGGSTGGGTSIPTIDEQAVSVATVGASVSTSADTAVSGLGTLSSEPPVGVREGIVNYVTRRIVESVAEIAEPGPEKTVSATQGDNSFTITFTNESVTNPSGGSATINGQMLFAFTQSGNDLTLTADGELESTVTNWASSVVVEGTTYNEIINGAWTFAFSGNVTATTVQGEISSITVNLITSIDSSAITVTGDVSGSATISDFSVTMAGSGTDVDNYSATCSGTVTVSRDAGGSATCTITSDCSGCE